MSVVIETKVDNFLVANVGTWNAKQERALIKLLKEQDRDTRHACAEAVLTEAGDKDTISVSAAHNACMNAKI